MAVIIAEFEAKVVKIHRLDSFLFPLKKKARECKALIL